MLPLSVVASPSINVQVLGSGGPESGDHRASSSYLVWIDGKSRVLVDVGGGSALRFEEVGAKLQDLEVILLTHLHVDHSADLPVLLKSSFFTESSGKLPIFGASGNFLMPSTEQFVQRLFATDKGAWQYLGDHLDGTASLQLHAKNIAETKDVVSIYNKDDLSIEAISVHHGPIPAIAFRVNVGDKSVTFSGDMNGDFHTLEKLAEETDILVMHNAVPKATGGVAANLHMTPITIGEIAQQSKAKRVIISHRMLRTLGRETETLKEIRKNYKGDVFFADDKDTFVVD